MNRILISIGAFIQSQVPVLQHRLFSVIGALALVVVCYTPTSYGQTDDLTEFEIVDGVPDGGFRLFEKSYVLLNREFEFIPMMFYENDRAIRPDLFEHFFHNNPDETQFTLEADYYSPIDNQQYQYIYPQADQPIAVVTAEPIQEPMYSVARYRNFKRTYKQRNPDPNKSPQVVSSFRSNDARVFRPVIRIIPFYLQLELLDPMYEDMFELKGALSRFFEPMQRNKPIGIQVSRIATGMFEPPFKSDERHIACPVWYEFKFIGYVDGFPRGLDGVDGATIHNLPDGVTFMSEIISCYESPPGAGGEIRGCAQVGGTKIAVRMDLLRDKFAVEAHNRRHLLGPVLLHELTHAYGFNDHSSDSDDLMYGRGVGETPYATREQCDMLTKHDSNRPHIGFAGYEPWGK